MISQNTNYRNTSKTFENLSKKFQIAPEVLSKANINEIKETLRARGIVLEKFNDSFNFLFENTIEQAREKLLGLPDVGPKTADVTLLFVQTKTYCQSIST